MSREHLSAISAVSMTGELYLAAQDHACKGPDIIKFLEQLSGYAPELNPDEGVWRHLEQVELRNLVGADLEQLTSGFWAAVERLWPGPTCCVPASGKWVMFSNTFT